VLQAVKVQSRAGCAEDVMLQHTPVAKSDHDNTTHIISAHHDTAVSYASQASLLANTQQLFM
jgi:hypothetical protein